MVSAVDRGAAISARGLTHSYSRGRARVDVLRGLDLEVEQGSHLALMGPSGAGKSTLLALVGGIEPPQGGELVVAGADLRRLRGGALSAFRRRSIGFVFQHYGLVEVLSAHENVALGLSLAGVPGPRRRQRAGELLELVGLADRRDHRPAELSGGERQRVALARALANDPAILLADEPTGNLDEEATARVLDLLERFRVERGCTLLVVTHDATVAARATTIRRLRDGRVEPDRDGGSRSDGETPTPLRPTAA